jgi:hypothetical protein
VRAKSPWLAKHWQIDAPTVDTLIVQSDEGQMPSASKAKYPDNRQKAWRGLSTGAANFLQKTWLPDRWGYATLKYENFKFDLLPDKEKNSWKGTASGPGKDFDELKSDSPMSVWDAKLKLYDMMLNRKRKSAVAAAAIKRQKTSAKGSPSGGTKRAG